MLQAARPGTVQREDMERVIAFIKEINATLRKLEGK